jgi:glycosyltransferase involved in cell wall biosynthesis
MRVVLAVGPSSGGIGTHVGALAGGLQSLGHDVRLLADPATALRFGWSEATAWQPRSPGSWAAARALAANADIVHAHGLHAGLVGPALPRRTGAGDSSRPAFVLSLHNELPSGGAQVLAGRVLRTLARRAALVTGASSDLVDVARWAGAREARLAPVPSPAVASLLTAPAPDEVARLEARRRVVTWGAPLDQPLVLTIARIAPQKQLDLLLNAALAVDAAGVAATWVVVGDGDPALWESLNRHPAVTGGLVRFVGARPDVTTWLTAASVFVLTSRWEARPLVIQEAMAAAVPVVAPAVGGIPDLLEAGGGRLVPTPDTASVADAIRDLLGDESARHRLGARGREVAGQWLDTPGTARQWAHWYGDLIEVT